MDEAPQSRTGPVAGSVGVVIRTRDRPLFLRRALESVAAQTHQDWRIVLVNDGGNAARIEALIDALSAGNAPSGGPQALGPGAATAPGPGKGTGTRLTAPFPRERVTLLHLTPAQGRSAAFNRGLERLDTDFVACLDDDDSWHPDFMRALLEFHHKVQPLVPDLGGVMAMVSAISEEVIRQPDGHETILERGEEGLANSFTRRSFLVNPLAYATYRHDLYPVQWMLRREAVAALGGFPEDFDVMEDRAFMARFLQHWQLAVLDRKLARHHRRLGRLADTARTAAMNTLDNPSYDWRLFADLALAPLHSPHGKHALAQDLPALIRAVAASVVKELNDETSALWHKIDGEARGLRDALGGSTGRHARNSASPERTAFSLWQALDGQQIGHAIAPGTAFAGGFTLSQGFDLPGQLVFADAAERRLVLQLPETRDWSALEVSLDGLAAPGTGLICEAVIGSDEGFLFETGLAHWQGSMLSGRKPRITATHVHHCPPHGHVLIRRDFAASELAAGSDCKLSIILPRAARNFRLVLHDLVISHPTATGAIATPRATAPDAAKAQGEGRG